MALTSPYIQDLQMSAPSRLPQSQLGNQAAVPVTLQRSMRLFNPQNIDLKVLLPENQNRTTVTPLVFKLGHPYFRPEEMKLLRGSSDHEGAIGRRAREARELRDELFRILRLARKPKGQPSFPGGRQRQ